MINILGLAVGLAAFILISLFVRHELSYDRYNRDFESIYRIVRNEYTLSPPAMVPALKKVIPEIEFATRLIMRNNLFVAVDDNYFTVDEYFWSENEFFNIFSVEFLQGDPETVLNSPADIIISESIARKFFGTKDPMGELITISNRDEYTVAGVFKDLPANSHFNLNIVLPVEKYYQISNDNPESWGSNNVYSYVKLNRQADMVSVNEKLVNLEKEILGWTPESGEEYKQYFFFQPISEIHLHSHRRQEIQVNGDIRNVFLYASIGLLILIIAGINYINLATAMSVKRHKEVGIKKALGISKSELISQFLTESVIIALLSTIIAIAIVIFSQSYFGRLMDRELSLGIDDIPFIAPCLLVLSIVVGLATGLIPSRSVSRVNVISIMKGSSTNRSRGNGLRNILVTIQFIVALALIILTINVNKQLAYIIDKDPGYDKEQIIIMRIFDRSLSKDIQTLKGELLANKNVVDVSASHNLPHNIDEFTRPEWFCSDPTDCTPISYNPVDYNFVELYNIEIVRGRNFSKDFPSDASGAFLVNEKAVNTAGWESPIGMEISHWDGSKGSIVGVVKDFNFQSMHSDIAPLYLMLDESAYSFFSIKINTGNIPGALEDIKSIFNKFSPNMPFSYTFFDQEFEQLYNGEKRLRSIFTFFSILAIILACLGLFGLSAFTISQRTKELGVRKVFGATNTDNILLLALNFLVPVILANILAWPLAYIALNKWLESFAFRINISISPFIIAAIIVLLITLITILSHSAKISRQTPAKSLRYE